MHNISTQLHQLRRVSINSFFYWNVLSYGIRIILDIYFFSFQTPQNSKSWIHSKTEQVVVQLSKWEVFRCLLGIQKPKILVLKSFQTFLCQNFGILSKSKTLVNWATTDHIMLYVSLSFLCDYIMSHNNSTWGFPLFGNGSHAFPSIELCGSLFDDIIAAMLIFVKKIDTKRENHEGSEKNKKKC